MVAPMFGIGVMELILLLGFPFQLPVGIPPGPENARILAVAPEECVFFMGWMGVGETAPGSENSTERLLADPEIRRSLDEVKSRIRAAVLQGAGSGEKSRTVAVEAQILAELLLTNPAALFAEKFTAAVPFDISAGLVVSLGDRSAAWEKSWRKLEETFGQKSETLEENGVNWNVMPAPNALGIDVRWAVSDGDFILAVGKETGSKTIARMKEGKPAKWLAELRERLPVPRLSAISYVNAEPLIAMFKETIRQIDPQQAELFKKLGLLKIQSFSGVSGLDATGFISRSRLKMDGHPEFFLKSLDAKPLSLDDLKVIPADATIAAAFRFDPERTLKEFVALVDTVGPRPGTSEEIFREFDQLSADIGFSIREDLLPAIGDSWRLYCSPSEGGALFTNWTAVVSVKDPKKLADIATVVAFKSREAKRLNKALAAGGNRVSFVTIEQLKSGNHELSYLNFAGEEMVVAPAWCFTGKEVVVSTFPQGILDYLNREKTSQSLADLPEVAACFQADAPLAFTRYDTPALARMLYPLALHFGNMIFSDLQRDGLDFQISMLPSLSALVKHLRPGTASVIVKDDGVEFISRRTLPLSAGPSSLLVPAVSLVGFRSSHRSFGTRLGVLDALSPDRAVLSVSKNNLKQIGLAMHNFHDSNSTFPAAMSVDADGKSLLSWRVQILPFLDQQELFDAFHHDEPWDSPHNKKLIAKMPAAYKSPGGKAGEGKTNYLTVRGEGTIFPGKEGVEIRQISDGTSNTAMVVEVNDANAVTWTKPDDLPLDDKMMKALSGFRKGGFLAGMADGSVRLIPAKFDAATVKNLFLTRDGNVLPEF